MMLKKKIFFIIILSLLQNCGYTPIHINNNQFKINIEKINFNGDWELNNFIDDSLKRYESKTEARKYNINIDTNYSKKSITKDTAGNTTTYLFTTEAKINVSYENTNKTYVYNESFTMSNLSDELDQTNYESSNKKNIADIIINKLMIQLSRLE